MPRSARIVAEGYPHHITQRGNNKQVVFRSDKDREHYLIWVKKYSAQYNIKILAYCLMSNHVHFVVIPGNKNSISHLFRSAHMRYAQYLHEKNKTSGHVWQGRFFSCMIDETYLSETVRYIEQNPVRAGLAAKPWQWKWSSAQLHVGFEQENTLPLCDLFEYVNFTTQTWKQHIDNSKGNIVPVQEKIKRHTSMGMPLGSNAFLSKIEGLLGIQIKGRKKGRPYK